MTETNESFDTIDLVELFGLLLRRIWTIILAALIAGSLAFGYTYFFVTPLYKASTLLYVNNSDISVGSSSFSITTGDLNAAQKLVDTYVVILKSRTVLNEVIEKADVNYTYGQLSGMITAGAVNSTEVLRIVVTCPNPAEAERIANTIAEILPERIPDIVNGSDVRIVDYAVVPSARSSPSFTKNTAIGVLVGAILSVAAIVLTYYFDENIRSEDYLSQTYPDIPLLAVIPNMRSSSRRGSRYGYGYANRYGYRSYRSGYYRNAYADAAGGKSSKDPLTRTSEKGAAK